MQRRGIERLDVEARQWCQRHLDRLVEKAKTRGLRAVFLRLEGNPIDQIVRAVRSTRADLLVLGTHGRTGFSKFFVGSVAARVVAIAPCPVVTVRGRAR